MKNLIKKFANLPALTTDKKLVVLFSDDWGSVRIRSNSDLTQLKQKGIAATSRFNRFDTLESDSDMEYLLEVLVKHKDRRGNHPVITAVTNVANPDFNQIKKNNFQEYFYETNQQTYSRYAASNNVLSLVKQGIDQNIFVPESHGREHVQVNWYLEELQNENSMARKVFDNEFFFLEAKHLSNSKRGRGLGAAFDVWNLADIQTHKKVIATGLEIFKKQYGYSSTIFTPPAIFYNPAIETDLVANNIQWLDVGRFFKTPQVGGGEKRQFNYLGRKKKSGLKVLVRNCVFESNMSDSDDGVNSCLAGIAEAFASKQPALISNHRACFVGGINEDNRTKGLKAIDTLITKILQKWPDAEFVSGNELAKRL